MSLTDVVCRNSACPADKVRVRLADSGGLKRTVHGKVNGRYVFPRLPTGERCMSENTLRTALRRMGYSNDEMTPHDFRAMARTILVEQLNVNPDVIEAQLAHGKSGPWGSACDRAEFIAQRRAMMSQGAGQRDKVNLDEDHGRAYQAR